MPLPHPTTTAAIEQEDALGRAEAAELNTIAQSLGEEIRRDRYFARVLAHALCRFLIDTFSRPSASGHEQFAADLVLLSRLLQLGPIGAENNPPAAAEMHLYADRLSARYFARVGVRGSWPTELRVPFELATMVRRAYEPNARKLLPLMVREARWLVTHADQGAQAGLDAVIAGVKKGASGT